MRRLIQLLRVPPSASRLSLRRPLYRAPPPPTHPTKHFSSTPPLDKYKVPQRKNVAMPSDTTTYKGKPFERAAFEQLMKVCAFDETLHACSC
jgi:hypothetical protein